MTIIFNKKGRTKKSADYVDGGLAIKARTTLFCLLTNPFSQESFNPASVVSFFKENFVQK